MGSVSGEYHIELRGNAKPFAIYTPRKVPLPLWTETKAELERMVEMGVIAPVHRATDWCAPMVVVPKKGSKKVRICVDLTKLNENVKRHYYPIHSIDTTLASLAGASVYTKLDMNHGFWQMKLSKESQHLTTFLSPFGRYRFLKVPFGISSAPELFQKRVNETLHGLRNVAIHMDDVLVWGRTQDEHDEVLEKVLSRLERDGFTLNKAKCLFSKNTVTFLGHILTTDGIRIDEAKVKAITDMEAPTNVAGVQRLLGMINFVGKYIPNKSHIIKPISELLNTKNSWHWGDPQSQAFSEIKKLLTSPPILAFYDPNRPTMISSDASSLGLGGVLLQKQEDDSWRPVAYISRTLSDCEQNYSNIEREALAVAWSCDKLRDYIIGKEIVIETDHKPLLSILKSKDLNDLTPRLQRIRIRLLRYSFKIVYTPGKHLATADCLSRSPTTKAKEAQYDLEDEIEAFINQIATQFNASDHMIDKIRLAQQIDALCRKLGEYCQSGWPEKNKLSTNLIPYYPSRDDLTLIDGLLLKGTRLVIPETLQGEILHRLHVGHLGINKIM